MPRKVKANKELEAGKSKWQDFAAKSKGLAKVAKKESMFRTGESVNARGKLISLPPRVEIVLIFLSGLHWLWNLDAKRREALQTRVRQGNTWRRLGLVGGAIRSMLFVI